MAGGYEKGAIGNSKGANLAMRVSPFSNHCPRVHFYRRFSSRICVHQVMRFVAFYNVVLPLSLAQ
jgi:hypothetical protein